MSEQQLPWAMLLFVGLLMAFPVAVRFVVMLDEWAWRKWRDKP